MKIALNKGNIYFLGNKEFALGVAVEVTAEEAEVLLAEKLTLLDGNQIVSIPLFVEVKEEVTSKRAKAAE